jgi:hypothetical protein
MPRRIIAGVRLIKSVPLIPLNPSYLLLGGLNILLTAQRFWLPHRKWTVVQNIHLSVPDVAMYLVSLTLFLTEPAYPNGLSLMSQFVCSFSSPARND